MSKESILKIKETEERAERIVADARLRAQELIATAEIEARAHCDAAEAQSTAELAAMLEKIRARTVTMAERMGEESDEEIAQMREQVALRRRIAEKIIIGGVVRKCR